jgi:signal transduction histidine kinase
MNKCQLLLVFILIVISINAQNESKVKYEQFKDSLIESGRQAYFGKKLSELQATTKRIDSTYFIQKDSFLLAKYYHFKALEFRLAYKNDSAYFYYQQSSNISKKLSDSLEIGRRLLSMAVIQREVKDYLGSEISSIKALKYLEPLKSYSYLESLYNNLGLVSEEMNKDQAAIDYYNKAYSRAKLIKNKSRQDIGYLRVKNNLGLFYQKKQEHKKAVRYFVEGLKYDSIKEKFPIQYSFLLENLTYCESKLGKKHNILERYWEVLSIRQKHLELKNLSTTYINIADFYANNNETEKAKIELKKAIQSAKLTKNYQRWLNAILLMSKLTKASESNKYLTDYIDLNDSLFQQERQLKNQFAKIRYETEKKDKENKELKIENEAKEIEILKEREQKTMGWFLAILGLLGLGISILIFNLKKRKAAFIAELEKVRVANNERDRIAQELHDGILGRLFGARFGLGFLPVGGGKEEEEKYGQLLDELQDIEKEIREVSHKLSYTPSSSSENFNAVINELIEEKTSIADLNYKIDIAKEINWDIIQKEIKTDIYRILQEALQNIIKHAKASSISVAIKDLENQLTLEIEDNGVGFNIDENAAGIGFKNMETRVKKLKVIFGVQSSKGKGTNISVHIPI